MPPVGTAFGCAGERPGCWLLRLRLLPVLSPLASEIKLTLFEVQLRSTPSWSRESEATRRHAAGPKAGCQCACGKKRPRAFAGSFHIIMSHFKFRAPSEPARGGPGARARAGVSVMSPAGRGPYSGRGSQSGPGPRCPPWPPSWPAESGSEQKKKGSSAQRAGRWQPEEANPQPRSSPASGSGSGSDAAFLAMRR